MTFAISVWNLVGYNVQTQLELNFVKEEYSVIMLSKQGMVNRQTSEVLKWWVQYFNEYFTVKVIDGEAWI